MTYLRGLGIIPIFLPAYCPFFNPIEFFFGLVKKKMNRKFPTCSSNNEFILQISKVLISFEHFSMRDLYKKCGYLETSFFNAGIAMGQSLENIGFAVNQQH